MSATQHGTATVVFCPSRRPQGSNWIEAGRWGQACVWPPSQHLLPLPGCCPPTSLGLPLRSSPADADWSGQRHLPPSGLQNRTSPQCLSPRPMSVIPRAVPANVTMPAPAPIQLRWTPSPVSPQTWIGTPGHCLRLPKQPPPVQSQLTPCLGVQRIWHAAFPLVVSRQEKARPSPRRV